MTLKPWREIAVPHEDVHKGSFIQAEFAADITQVHDGKARPEYQDAVLFFQRTFITEGMAALLMSVAKRMTGKGGDPVIQLQTAFGGGKTHTMLAVMHMVSGHVPTTDMAGIPTLLDKAGVMALPRAKVAVLDGTKLSPSQPRRADGHTLRTMWGDLAWQLGGAGAYALVADADATGTNPGKDVLATVLEQAGPCVILVDELVAYIRQFTDGSVLPGGTYDSNLTFIQALTEAVKVVPHATLLASLPESEREAGSERGIAALRALEHYFGRVQAIWKPVSTEESFEIVRRRLFTEIRDQGARDAVCRAFADLYVKHADDLPGETQEGRYYDRLRAAYPIHPEVFERLYTDWSALPSFQRTRGVLKLMASVIHRLWQSPEKDFLILPGSLPLYDKQVVAEMTNHLPPGWDPVIEHDVDGDRSTPALMDTQEAKFGAVQACRRMTRGIFLGSAPSAVNDKAKGVETMRLVLGCLQPGYAPHVFRDALTRLESRLTYLNKGVERWWFDVRPNLRREMEDRKRRFTEQSVIDEVAEELKKVLRGGAIDNHHIFTQAADVPDEWDLRVVVLSPNSGWTRTGPNPARDAATAILRMRGEQPRQKQNRVLFLAADADQVLHLKDTVRALLAWRSIEADIRDLRLNLDNIQSRQATQNREQTSSTVQRLVRETFKWLVVPSQGAKRDGTLAEVEWEAFVLNPASMGLGKEIDRVLAENELVISAWAPTHLHNLLKAWFWKDSAVEVLALEVWQKSCCYLYMPRLAKASVMHSTIAAGAPSREFFAIAQGKQGDRYVGFVYGQSTTPVLDGNLLVIEPAHAAAYEEAHRPAPAPAMVGTTTTSPLGNETLPSTVSTSSAETAHSPVSTAALTHFYAHTELDFQKPLAIQFSKIVNELVELFSQRHGTVVTVKVDIAVSDERGFDEATVRAARENAKVLGMRNAEFEE
jgi:uncharacterized protein